MKTGMLLNETNGQGIYLNCLSVVGLPRRPNPRRHRASRTSISSMGVECSYPQRSTELGRVHAERSKTARTGMDERENTSLLSGGSYRGRSHFHRRSQSMIYWMLRNKLITCVMIAMVASPSYFFKDHIAAPIKQGRDASIKTMGKVYKEVKKSKLGRKVDNFIER
jgi:hypothetical protein